jgi:hypothetical protein
MTASPLTSPTADEVEVARLLLARLGVRPEDLLAVPHREPAQQRPPTFSDYIAVLIAGRPPGPRVYFPYWKRLHRRRHRAVRLGAVAVPVLPAASS